MNTTWISFTSAYWLLSIKSFQNRNRSSLPTWNINLSTVIVSNYSSNIHTKGCSSSNFCITEPPTFMKYNTLLFSTNFEITENGHILENLRGANWFDDCNNLKNDNDDNVFNSLNIFTILPLNTWDFRLWWQEQIQEPKTK